MNSSTAINLFLDRIRKKWLSARLLGGIYLLLAVLTGGFSVINFYAWSAETPGEFIIPLLSLLAFFLLILLIRFLVQPALNGISRENAALSAEKRWPELNNSLINSCQLQKFLEERDQGISQALIRQLLLETERKIAPLDVRSLPENLESRRNLNRFLAALIILILAGTFIPDFFTAGYDKLVNSSSNHQTILTGNAQSLKQPTVTPPAYSVSEIVLKFNYPAYTRRESETRASQDGKINVLPGTEVRIDANSNLPLTGADLVINDRDAFSMDVDGLKLSGSFMAREKGFYQFRIRDGEGNRILLPAKYPINIQRDSAPRIILFLSNPKPVYMDTDKVLFYYEGHDDFGVQSVDLLFSKNGKPGAKRIKTVRGQETTVKDGYTWNLSEMILRPGDKIEYYLEIMDNDNVNGPNAGQSEIYSFSIFDSRKELDNLIALQDELTNRMIGLLADTLIERRLILAGKLADPVEIKKSVAISSDRLIRIIQLAQKIYEQAKPIQMFSPAYLIFFKNIRTGLTEIREEQIETLKKLDTAIGQTTPVGLNFPPVESLDRKLIEHLERDILFLVKINNRQKMDQVMDLENQLKEMTDSLREEFEKIRNKKAPPSVDELRQRLQKMKHLLKKMMEQLARQTQGLPDEFLNPDSVKQLNLDMFKESLDRIMDMVNKGKMDQAMKELEKMADDLQTLANQFDQARDSMDEMMDMELMKKIDQSLKALDKLEKKQKDLLDQTAKINQELREKQAGKFENKLKEFFESLKKDVESARNLLKETNKFLKMNDQLEKHDALLDHEDRLNRKLQALRQETVDSATKPDVENKFEEMNQTRRELGALAFKKRELQMATYKEFKDSLPEMKEKYDGLKELAELFDIREFNALFKSAYPMAFRWQHKLRMIPRPNEELSQRLGKDMTDLRAINAEISKKLGSMTRELEQEYNSLISDENKSRLREMAKQQNQLREQSREIEQQLSRMGRENPMIDPDLPSKMSSAGRYMKIAEKKLRKPDVPQSIESENGALEKLAETRDMLNQLKNDSQGQPNSRPRPIPKFGTGRARDPRRGGSIRMQKEKVDLPSEDQYKGAMKFRADILEAMKGRYPRQYERFVSEYYKELVK